MPDRPPVPQAIVRGKLVGIGRNLDAARIDRLAPALLDAGLPAFEVTLQGSDPYAAITRLRTIAGERMLVGAGTVLDATAAQRALDAGAEFLVMPITDPGLVAWAAERGVAAFPGALTPTEIIAGWRAGAAAIKLFPASGVGATYLRELRGPFPDIPLMPTGGITADNATGWLDAGAVALGIGSWLTGDPDPAVVRERASRLVRLVATAPARAA